MSQFHHPWFQNTTNNTPTSAQEIRSFWSDLGGVDVYAIDFPEELTFYRPPEVAIGKLL